MNDVDTIIKASNIEMALATYFDYPTVEEAHALKIINARLQADQEISRIRIEKALKEAI